MKFTKWLTEYAGNSETVEMIAAWARGILPTTPLDACANLHDVEVVGRTEGLCDEALEALRETWHAYVNECADATSRLSQPNLMANPYTPGARTTLADARLQLVCAALSGTDYYSSSIEEAVADAIKVADLALKLMDG